MASYSTVRLRTPGVHAGKPKKEKPGEIDEIAHDLLL
jgi:hypothetical protein